MGFPFAPKIGSFCAAPVSWYFSAGIPAEIYDTADMSGRPLGQQGRDAFLSRFAQREPVYREFSHMIIQDFSSPEATVAEILTKLEGQL